MGDLSEALNNFSVCTLCPHFCRIREGKKGICGVRTNRGGRIEPVNYGSVSGYAVDPVEKKPLYHFFPGYSILSVGSYGCNMRCDFCQNWHISQRAPDINFRSSTPEMLVNEALHIRNNIGIAFTYNEPIVWFEFMRDVSLAVREKGMLTAMVSNGYVNPEPLNEIISFMDAFNIDLKAFTDSFYRKITGASLKPVLQSLKQIASSGRHLEITTLIIPGLNDDPADMEEEAKWIAGELGPLTPLHLSRYHPTYKREDPSTPQATLDRLFNVASEHLLHVYMGNTLSSGGGDTKCPDCGTIVTRRSGFNVRMMSIDPEGRCSKCGFLVYSYFNFPSSEVH